MVQVGLQTDQVPGSNSGDIADIYGPIEDPFSHPVAGNRAVRFGEGIGWGSEGCPPPPTAFPDCPGPSGGLWPVSRQSLPTFEKLKVKPDARHVDTHLVNEASGSFKSTIVASRQQAH